jgi:hypothetical protein
LPTVLIRNRQLFLVTRYKFFKTTGRLEKFQLKTGTKKPPLSFQKGGFEEHDCQFFEGLAVIILSRFCQCN